MVSRSGAVVAVQRSEGIHTVTGGVALTFPDARWVTVPRQLRTNVRASHTNSAATPTLAALDGPRLRLLLSRGDAVGVEVAVVTAAVRQRRVAWRALSFAAVSLVAVAVVLSFPKPRGFIAKISRSFMASMKESKKTKSW